MYAVAGSDPGHFIFWCPGCQCVHGINAGWSFNGDVVKPTVSPSLLSRGQILCHLFIRDGKLEYLSDSQHEFAGQTIEMVELPWKHTT